METAGVLPDFEVAGALGCAPNATAFQLRWDERLPMKVTSERIRNASNVELS